MAGPTLGQIFKFKSPPKAPHVPYLGGWGVTLIGALLQAFYASLDLWPLILSV